jgi:hypothetical protein
MGFALCGSGQCGNVAGVHAKDGDSMHLQNVCNTPHFHKVQTQEQDTSTMSHCESQILVIL